MSRRWIGVSKVDFDKDKLSDDDVDTYVQKRQQANYLERQIRKFSPHNRLLVIVILCLVLFIKFLYFFTAFYYIPRSLQSTLNKDNGTIDVHKFHIASLSNEKIKYQGDITLYLLEPSAVTLDMHPAPCSLSVKTKESEHFKVFGMTELPSAHIPASASQFDVNMDDEIQITDYSYIKQLVIRALAWDDEPKTFFFEISSRPQFDARVLAASWPMDYIRRRNITLDVGREYNTSKYELNVLRPALDTGTENGQTYFTLNGTFSFLNPSPISIAPLDAGIAVSISYLGKHLAHITVPDISLNSTAKERNELFFRIETDPYTQSELLECIDKYSKGERVELTLDNFQWISDMTEHDWIQDKVLQGLSVTVPLQASKGAAKTLELLQLFVAFVKLMDMF